MLGKKGGKPEAAVERRVIGNEEVIVVGGVVQTTTLTDKNGNPVKVKIVGGKPS